jgi:protoporphyrinogen oxidase
MTRHIVVLGAGPGGLAAAWKLTAAGHAVTVLERESVTGGLARTFSYRDFLFDYGPHLFHDQVPEVVEEMKALLGVDLLERRNFMAQVVWRNKFVEYPLRGADVFQTINLFLAAYCVVDFAAARLRHRLFPAREVDTFESWVTNRFGRTLYNLYFGPYTQKVWGRDPSELSGAFASQRIPVLHLWDLIQRTFFGKKGGTFRENPWAVVSYYPRKGIGQICDRFVEQVVSKGGKILTEVDVLGIEMGEGGVRSVEFRRGGQPEQLRCDFVLSTIPIRDFIPLFSPFPPSTVLEAADGMHYRAARLMYLLLDREQVSGTPFIYFSNPEVIFNRIYEVRVFSEDMTPANKTALCVEITCQPGDEHWRATDKELFPDVIGPLERAGLIDEKDVYDYFSRFLNHAYPIYEVGFEKRMTKIMEFVNGIQNVLTYGRQGIFSYTNTDNSIDMALRSVAYIASYFEGKTHKIQKSDLFRDYTLGY